jgi:cytochrome c-type biogenesis protein CcmH/NrfF
MNSVGLNMLLWLLLVVVAVVGKLLFEHLLTRAEERKALASARSARHVAPSGVGGPSSP